MMDLITKNSPSRLGKICFLAQSSSFQVIFLMLLSSFVFIGLGKSSLLDYDEAIYAQVAREMIRNNDWLTLTFGDSLWFEKPPLYIWTTASLFKLFGINEFWARAASATSGILAIGFTYIIGSTVYNRRVGLLAVVPLLTGYEFLRQARNGTTDVMLTLFMLMAITAYINYSKNGPKSWYLIFISFSLGFMVKFWAAFLVLIAIGINIVLEKKVQATISCKHFWGAILVTLALTLPWHITMYIMHGQAFVDRYLIYDLLNRTLNPLESNTGTTRYYFDRLMYDFSPWFLLLPIALTMELVRILNNRDKSSLLLVFTACIFGVYSLLVDTKIFHYLTPIYPFLSIFIANTIVKAYENFRTYAFSGLFIASSIAIIIPSTKMIGYFSILFIVSAIIIFLARCINSARGLITKFKSLLTVKCIKFIIEVSARLLALLKTFTKRKNIPKLAVVIMFMFLTMIGISRSRQLYQVIESPVEQIARIAGRSDIVRDETIIALALPPDYENAIVGPTAMFYSKRPIEVAWTKEYLWIFTSEGSREIIMGEIFIDALDNEYEFSILARSSPFVYGIIWQKDEP